MPQYIRRTTLVAALAATTLSAHAQDGDIAAGHSFAREACSACHVLEAEQQRIRGAFLSDRVSATSPTDPA
jgi:cytochrome c2